MSIAQLPVDPSLDDKGRIRSLIPLLGEESSYPVPLDKLDGLWDTEMEARTDSTDVYARLGASGIASGQAGIDSKTAVWDALVGKKRVADTAGASTVIFETFWGIGLRITLTYRSADIGASANVAAIAANAEFRKLDVQYEVRSIGLGPLEMADVLSTIPPLGRFDMNAYGLMENVRMNLRKALLDRLKVAREQASLLQPAIVTLSSVPFADAFTEAAEYRFTMQSIASGLSRKDALARLSGGAWGMVRKERVEAIYDEVVGSKVATPGLDAKQAAQSWLSND